MNREDGAEQNRRGRDGDDTGPQPKDQRDAAQHFGGHHDISEVGRHADAGKEFYRSRQSEDEKLDAGMRQEEQAQADAKQQRGIGSRSGIDHGYLLRSCSAYGLFFSGDNLLIGKYRSYSWSEMADVRSPDRP